MRLSTIVHTDSEYFTRHRDRPAAVFLGHLHSVYFALHFARRQVLIKALSKNRSCGSGYLLYVNPLTYLHHIAAIIICFNSG